MKNIVLISLIASALPLVAQASCPNLSGRYQPFVEPFAGTEAGPYGTVLISKGQDAGNSCKYQLTNNVKDYAAPLKSGTQSLVVFKPRNSESEFQLLDSNGQRNPIGKGTLYVGSEGQITLMISLTGCGGEGGGAVCGEYVILR